MMPPEQLSQINRGGLPPLANAHRPLHARPLRGMKAVGVGGHTLYTHHAPNGCPGAQSDIGPEPQFGAIPQVSTVRQVCADRAVLAPRISDGITESDCSLGQLSGLGLATDEGNRATAGYVAAYNEPFSSEQLAAHRQCIELRHQAGGARDPDRAGIGGRASYLVHEPGFTGALAATLPSLELLEPLRGVAGMSGPCD
jgi:hypothetical protein